MSKHQGFILITILLFLQIFLLLSLCAFEISWLETKSAQEKLGDYYALNQLEPLIKTIEQEIQEGHPLCLILPLPSNELLHKPLSWWQTQSCAGNFQSIQYHYVFESLGQDPCAQIKRLPGRIANYYRLTLIMDAEHKLSVQSTIITPALENETCRKTIHFVETGRQSWHFLIREMNHENIVATQVRTPPPLKKGD